MSQDHGRCHLRDPKFRPVYRARNTVRMVCDEHVDRLWRVEGGPDDKWLVEYIGYVPHAGPAFREYQSSTDFPMWLKERIAVLSMLDTDPHGSIVWGVGRRVNTYIYWVVEPREGETSGKDT